MFLFDPNAKYSTRGQPVSYYLKGALLAGHFRVNVSRPAAVGRVAGAVNKKALLFAGRAFIRRIISLQRIAAP